MSSRRPDRVLPASFYRRATLAVAEGLIGKVLVHRTSDGTAAGMIVETEAYVGEDDPACHAAPGPTPRNAPLYGPPGVAYVFLSYGRHYLVNAVTEPAGRPAAVLLRALEPLDNVELMARRRQRGDRRIEVAGLCRGPGNLSRALAISLDQNRLPLTGPRLWIEDRGLAPGPVAWGPRIGIRVGLDRRWRCTVQGHPCVSRALRPAARSRDTRPA
jgi:DNA-3-methyladenine glycosylase